MIDNIISLLLYGLLFAVLIQPNNERLLIAFWFVAITLTHELLLSTAGGFLYYGSAALFDLVIMLFIANASHVSRTSVMMLKVCLASILANMIGWSLWFSFWPPIVYNILYIFIYSWALLVLLNQDEIINVGRSIMARLFPCFSVHSGAGGVSVLENRCAI
jgi:hypothetical protein